ncbi:MAG TPA: hypothetical protein VFR02_05260, partial [bacterium]|nr:hypothetical protein [bacterium]
MTFRTIPWLFLALAGTLPAFAAGPALESQLGFYGDHEGFDGPFHPAQDFLGAWVKTRLAAATGDSTGFEAGLYARDGDPGQTRVLPWLRFEYHTPTTRLLMGSLESADRHGFLAPLEDPTLSFTRPVEYGLQWLEKDEG